MTKSGCMNLFQRIISFLGHWRWVLKYEFIPVRQARRRYCVTLKRISAKVASGKKLKVVFLSGEISKWKVQSLYDWMKNSSFFEPVVALTLTSALRDSLNPAERRRRFEDARSFFAARGIEPIEALEPETGQYHDMKSLGADIVFYYQPWDLSGEHQPHMVAKSALTCYVPYYVPNYGDLKMDAQQPFHRTLWAYFILNEEWEALFRKAVKPWMTASRLVGLGHPMLDVFNAKLETQEDKCIVT